MDWGTYFIILGICLTVIILILVLSFTLMSKRDNDYWDEWERNLNEEDKNRKDDYWDKRDGYAGKYAGQPKLKERVEDNGFGDATAAATMGLQSDILYQHQHFDSHRDTANDFNGFGNGGDFGGGGADSSWDSSSSDSGSFDSSSSD